MMEQYKVVVTSMNFEVIQIWVQIPGLPLTVVTYNTLTY